MAFLGLDNIFQRFRSKRSTPTEREGSRGTQVLGGFIQEKEDNSDLTGFQKYTTYSNMLSNVSIVATGVRHFLNLVAKPEWKVEPADDSDEAQKIADAVESAMKDIDTPWHRVIRRAAMYRFYGFGVQEWTAKKLSDGTIGMEDVEPRPQSTIERWDIDENGNVRGIIQRDPQTQEELYLHREKVVYLVDDSLNDSPEGFGLFRNVVETSRRLLKYEQLEGWGFETDLRGIPVGYAPFQELDNEVEQGILPDSVRKDLLKPLQDFAKKHNKNPKTGLLLDSAPYAGSGEQKTPASTRKFSLELLSSSSQSHAEVAKAIERLNREIARILGVESLLLGDGDRGSFAMSRDKSQTFALIIDSTLKELVEAFEKDFVMRLIVLNGWNEDLAPTLKPDKLQHRDVTELSEVLKNMAIAGAEISPADPVVDEMRDLLGLSKQDMDALLAEMDLAREQEEALLEQTRTSLEGGKKPKDDDPVDEALEDEDEQAARRRGDS